MPHDIEPHLLSRRRVLAFAASASAFCIRSFAFASDFWNKKAPADWSSEEVHQLLNKSPWSKQVTAEVARSGGGGGGNRSSSGMGGSGSDIGRGGMGGGGGRGGGGGMGGMGGGGGRGGVGGNTGIENAGGGGGSTPRPTQQFKGVVRWESAKPVLEASKSTMPEAFTNCYVISIIGLPMSGRRSDSTDDQPKLSKTAADRIKSASSLTPKGKDAVPASVVQLVASILLIGFPKDSAKLSGDDKEVAFATMIGRMAVKTKFTFKEMMYHEDLAI